MLALLAAPACADAQQPAAEAVKSRVTEPAAPAIPRERMELFLQTAKIVGQKPAGVGINQTIRATLADGRMTHDAHIACFDIYRPVWRGRWGTVERHFRDTYKFNIAAYRLDKLLGLDMVPVSVEREVNGKPCSVTWWVDDLQFSEAERRDRKIGAPANQFWVDQLNKVRVFDQLIHNTDRTQENLLIDQNWKIWMIDHTRAFRTQKTLLRPDVLRRCDYNLLQGMRRLNLPGLMKELKPYLRNEEMTALLARRDLIVRFFEKEIAQKGGDTVLSDIPRSTPRASIP